MCLFTGRCVNQFRLLQFAVLGAVMLMANFAHAVPIFVPNFSFEDNNIPGEGGNIAPMDDWIVVTTGTSRTFNPTDSQFTGTTGGNIPSPGEGNQISLSNLNSGEVTTLTSAASLGLVQAGSTYTLTVAGGNRAGSGGVTDPDQYTIEILVDGIAAATTVLDGNTIPDDSFQDIMTSFIATGAHDGGDLTVRLTHTWIDGSTATGHFDNVRLDSFTPLPVPEPSSALLFGTGSLGLIRLARRKKSPS